MSTKPILVAGGAGYIGSHFCHVAAKSGFFPIVIDRVGPSTPRVEAYRRAIGQHFPLEVCDIGDEARVRQLAERHAPVAAICFAALIEVGQSVAEPALYWDNNYLRTMRFLRALTGAGVHRLVFSSTAAVYDANTGTRSLKEEDRLAPASPYGLTKLACELMLQGASNAHNVSPGVRFEPPHFTWPPAPPAPAGPAALAPSASLILRYFNAAGADPGEGLGEVHQPETHLIPNAIAPLLRVTDKGDKAVLTIHGDDYATVDGTCVRDYVHVLDLADAHVAGIEYLLNAGRSDTVNLGSGSGYSIHQVLAAIEQVSGCSIAKRIGPRRAGDPPRLVADVAKAQKILGWQPRRSLHDIVASALEFHRQRGVG